MSKDTLGSKIKILRDKGYKLKQIKNELNCSLSIISYHLSDDQRTKYIKRAIKNQHNVHPFSRKLIDFKSRIKRLQTKKTINTKKALYDKISKFHTNRKTKMKETPTFNLTDVKNKFGNNPKCYLTGRSININQTSEYHFDHVIPSSKNGTNTLDNLQIAINDANYAKGDMLLEDFLQMCKEICIQHNIKTI